MNYLGSAPSQRLELNQTQAMAVIQAASQAASQIGSPSNIAVTDAYGYLVAFLRTNNAFLGSIDISMKKAKTVALFNGAYTSAAFYNLTQPGQMLYGIEETNSGLVVFGGSLSRTIQPGELANSTVGGVPIYVNQYFVGAIGVSGGTTTQDIYVATAGADAIGSVNSTVT
jgi:uncharacterized protein GlcG (DUF336 family)